MSGTRASRIPTFRRWWAALAPHLQRPVMHDAARPWAVAVGVVALVDAAATIGASFWRYADARAAWPATQAAVADWQRAVDAMPDKGSVGLVGWDFPPPTLDLDLSAATVQIAAATTAFAVLLAAAMLLAMRGRRVLAVVAALAPAVSVAVMGGPLARLAPMIPVHGLPAPPAEMTSAWPAALRPSMLEIDLAVTEVDTPVWWNAALAVVVGVIAVAAVAHILRRGPLVESAPLRGRPDFVGALVGSAAGLAVLSEPRDYGSVALTFVAGTCVVAFALAAAGAVAHLGSALALSLGMLATHGLVLLAFDRGSGAPGGWGVGSGGAQVSATTASAVVLVAAPLAGSALAVAWAALPIHSVRPLRAVTT